MLRYITTLFLTLSAFFLMYHHGQAQQKYLVKIKSDKPFSEYLSNLENQLLDSVELKKILYEYVEIEKNQGFLLANVDVLDFQKDTAFIKIFLGEKYEKILLENQGIPKAIIKNMGLKWKNGQSNISFQDLNKVFEKVVSHYQNNGYPFTSVKLDSIRRNGYNFSTQLSIETGPIITFDSLVVRPSGLVKYQYLTSYLNIQKGQLYDQFRIDLISQRIALLPYLQLVNKPNVSFRLGKGQVTLELEPKKVNTFDGIAGLVPGENGAGSRLTGELKLSFNNLFKSGKKVDFEWQKLNDKSQYLDAKYLHPLLFQSPLNFSFNYNQLKEDTLFSNREFGLGIDYNLSNSINVSINYSNKNGNNLNEVDLNTGDFDINLYTLGLNAQKIDDIEFPRNGFSMESRISIGEKKSSLNTRGNLERNTSNQYQFFGQIGLYKQLTKRAVLHTKVSGGYLVNDQLFINDLFRIGGLNSLRGFNEKLFFASKYGLVNVEMRWLMSEGSYFLVFADQALLRYDLKNSNFSDSPTGMGLGFRIKTKTGLFNLIYALGKTADQNFSFNFSKLHFGYAATL